MGVPTALQKLPDVPDTYPGCDEVDRVPYAEHVVSGAENRGERVVTIRDTMS